MAESTLDRVIKYTKLVKNLYGLALYGMIAAAFVVVVFMANVLYHLAKRVRWPTAFARAQAAHSLDPKATRVKTDAAEGPLAFSSVGGGLRGAWDRLKATEPAAVQSRLDATRVLRMSCSCDVSTLLSPSANKARVDALLFAKGADDFVLLRACYAMQAWEKGYVPLWQDPNRQGVESVGDVKPPGDYADFVQRFVPQSRHGAFFGGWAKRLGLVSSKPLPWKSLSQAEKTNTINRLLSNPGFPLASANMEQGRNRLNEIESALRVFERQVMAASADFMCLVNPVELAFLANPRTMSRASLDEAHDVVGSIRRMDATSRAAVADWLRGAATLPPKFVSRDLAASMAKIPSVSFAECVSPSKTTSDFTASWKDESGVVGSHPAFRKRMTAMMVTLAALADVHVMLVGYKSAHVYNEFWEANRPSLFNEIWIPYYRSTWQLGLFPRWKELWRDKSYDQKQRDMIRQMLSWSRSLPKSAGERLVKGGGEDYSATTTVEGFQADMSRTRRLSRQERRRENNSMKGGNALNRGFKRIVNKASKTVKEVPGKALDGTLGRLWDKIKDAFEDAYDKLTNFVGDSVNSIEDTIVNDLWGGIVGVKNDLWRGITGVKDDLWRGTQMVGDTVKNDLWRGITGVKDDLWRGTQTVGDGITRSVKTVEGKIDNMSSGMNRVVGDIKGTADTIERSVKGVVRDVGDGARRAVDDIRNVAQGAASEIRNGAQGVAKDIRDGAQGAANKFVDTAKGVVNDVKKGTEGAVNTMREGVQGAVGEIRNVANKAVNEIKGVEKSLLGGFNDILRPFQDFGKSVREFFKRFSGFFKSIGDFFKRIFTNPTAFLINLVLLFLSIAAMAFMEIVAVIARVSPFNKAVRLRFALPLVAETAAQSVATMFIAWYALLLTVANAASNGRLRDIVRCDSTPGMWFTDPLFHRGGMHHGRQRLMHYLCLRSCPEGSKPFAAFPLVCASLSKKEKAESQYCPTAALYRLHNGLGLRKGVAYDSRVDDSAACSQPASMPQTASLLVQHCAASHSSKHGRDLRLVSLGLPLRSCTSVSAAMAFGSKSVSDSVAEVLRPIRSARSRAKSAGTAATRHYLLSLLKLFAVVSTVVASCVVATSASGLLEAQKV